MMLKGQRRLVPSHRTKENWGGPLAPVGHCKDFSSYCESMESDRWIPAEKDPGLTFLGKDPWASCGEHRPWEASAGTGRTINAFILEVWRERH